jgi:hypothetical protein
MGPRSERSRPSHSSTSLSSAAAAALPLMPRRIASSNQLAMAAPSAGGIGDAGGSSLSTFRSVRRAESLGSTSTNEACARASRGMSAAAPPGHTRYYGLI